MEADKVINAIFKYLEKNMVPGMNDLQEVAFYAIKEAVDEEVESLVEIIKSKPLMRAVLAVDKAGDVDIEKLANRVRKGIEAKGGVSVDVPLYGPVRFVPDDIDNILIELKENGNDENYQNLGRTY